MSQSIAPALAASIRSQRAATLAQVAVLLSLVLVMFHLWSGLVSPLLFWDLPIDDQVRLVLVWSGNANQDVALHASQGAVYAIAAVAATPYVLISLALCCLALFFGSARRSATPSTRTVSYLRTFGFTFAVAAMLAPLVLPLCWIIAGHSLGRPVDAVPLRVSVEHVLLLLLSVAPFAMASVMRDAADASEDARSIV